MAEKKPYPILSIVNWYYGNYCTRKCFNKEEKISECRNKLMDFASKNEGLRLTPKEFKALFDNDNITICKLKASFIKKTIFWKQFKKFTEYHDFDADKMS